MDTIFWSMVFYVVIMAAWFLFIAFLSFVIDFREERKSRKLQEEVEVFWASKTPQERELHDFHKHQGSW